MSVNDPSEVSAEASSGNSNDGFLNILRVVALTALIVGAGGSLGFMLWVGHRNPQPLLLIIFAIWVLSPFGALVFANAVSKRWSIFARATIYGEMLVVALVSLAIYGKVALTPLKRTPASAFLMVPLGSWVLMAVATSIAVLVSRRRRN